MKKIAIVILNFNSAKNTIECLESIKQLEKGDSELLTVVVDNASTEELRVDPPAGEAGSGELKVGELKIIRNKENLGFAGGNNVGIKYALDQGADYILILNNDTFVEKNLIKELLETSESDSKIGVVVPKIYFSKGYEFHKDRYQEKEKGKVFWFGGGLIDWKNVIVAHRGVDEVDGGQYEKTYETDFATGCCMLIKREVLERVNLFDEKYFLYYEDTDLSMRIKKTGYKIIYNPKAILWHKNAGSSGGSGSALQDYYTTRNRLVFGFKYAPLRAKFALLRESLKLIISGRHWQKKGVLDFFYNNLGKGSYKL